MKILNPKANIEAFFDRLKTDPSLLMLDYDGTLAPFVVDRNAAYPYKGVWEQVCKLFLMHKTRVVIISGRMISSLRHLIPKGPLPELWGCHGFERWSSEKGYVAFQPPEMALKGLDRAEKLSKEFLDEKHIERKNASLVVHWRGLSKEMQEEMRHQTSQSWEQLIDDYPLEILYGDGVMEIRALGKHKGDVVKEVLTEMPKNVCAAYLGDDATDEDAFAALSGKGLSILVKKDEKETSADIQITPPDELQWFFDTWITAVEVSQ